MKKLLVTLLLLTGAMNIAAMDQLPYELHGNVLVSLVDGETEESAVQNIKQYTSINKKSTHLLSDRFLIGGVMNTLTQRFGKNNAYFVAQFNRAPLYSWIRKYSVSNLNVIAVAKMTESLLDNTSDQNRFKKIDCFVKQTSALHTATTKSLLYRYAAEKPNYENINYLGKLVTKPLDFTLAKSLEFFLPGLKSDNRQEERKKIIYYLYDKFPFLSKHIANNQDKANLSDILQNNFNK